jgi:hypothetical protein
MEIINKINKAIKRYEEVYQNATIDELISVLDYLSINSYYLAQLSADLKQSYNTSYYIRKINISKSVHSIINNSKISKAQAQIQADCENEDLIKQENENEAMSFRVDLLLRQVNRILDTIRTKISYLKSEKELVKNQT